MNVRELSALLMAVPPEHRELEVTILMMHDAGGGEWGIQGVITAFEQFPATTEDPQPPPATYQIYAREGTAVAAEIEMLRKFQEFHDSEGTGT